MANPSFRAAGTKTNGSGGTTISVPAPAGHQAGDLLILLVLGYDGGTTLPTIATPSGWTQIASSDSGNWAAAAPADKAMNVVFWKIAASSSEPNVSVVQTPAGLPEAQMYAVQGGVHATTPIDVSAGWASPATSTSIPSPAITTVTNNALVVYLGCSFGSAAWNTPPTGATERHESGIFDSKFIWADLTKTPAGAVSASSYGLGGGAKSHIMAFAVRPLPTAVTPVADFTGTPLSGAYTLSVAFTDTSTNTPTSWAWTFGDGGTSTVQNPSHSYTAAGTYTVALVATNAAGSNTKTRTGYVVVSTPVTAPVADFSATPRSGDRPLTVVFTDLSA